MTEFGLDRRRFLKGIGTLVAAGTLAGCTGSGDGSDGSDNDGSTGDGGNDGGDGNDGSDGNDGTGGNDGGGGGTVSTEAKSRVDAYLTSDPPANNYDGSIEDATGSSEVTVKVAATGGDSSFAFGPAAVAVSTGTTVTWEWTGEAGRHNVVSTGDSDLRFDSGQPMATGTFTQTFDQAGVGLYRCTPHVTLGMKGAVVVVEG